jgi:hypothetical protein
MARFILPLVAFQLMVPPAFAQDGKTSGLAFETMGPGTTVCADYLTQITNHQQDEEFFFFWVQGYMSGANAELRNAGRPRRKLSSPLNPRAAQMAMVKKFCTDNPRQPYVSAADALFRSLPLMTSE